MKTSLSLLEQVASAVLVAVLLSLGWIILAAWKIPWFRLPSVPLEVILVIGLLLAALVLVSVVALRQTRGPE